MMHLFNMHMQFMLPICLINIWFEKRLISTTFLGPYYSLCRMSRKCKNILLLSVIGKRILFTRMKMCEHREPGLLLNDGFPSHICALSFCGENVQLNYSLMQLYVHKNKHPSKIYFVILS